MKRDRDPCTSTVLRVDIPVQSILSFTSTVVYSVVLFFWTYEYR